ncbi:hypothetical protein A2V68_01500 [candidate division Kazan bacterium RBG_13_50_9]|uniref:Uncharacterized protein n=1 Tax=candidate division Kazan bacterium RBG_13_50_9 TaxID=1798535 RepID=A0A1F4NRA9_UNCK3|nr:MAG: hypothetical protein A2V68_01500 [candidate division Kazan bacterium RBG_13_50_9]
MSFLNLFKFGYYFDSMPGYTFPGFWIVLIILIVVFVVSLAGSFRLSRARDMSGHKKMLWSSWVNLGYLLSLVGLAWLFFRYQGVVYLNWRLWPALLAIGVVGWTGYLIYLSRWVLPQKLSRQQEKVSQAYYFRHRKGRRKR